VSKSLSEFTFPFSGGKGGRWPGVEEKTGGKRGKAYFNKGTKVSKNGSKNTIGGSTLLWVGGKTFFFPQGVKKKFQTLLDGRKVNSFGIAYEGSSLSRAEGKRRGSTRLSLSRMVPKTEKEKGNYAPKRSTNKGQAKKFSKQENMENLAKSRGKEISKHPNKKTWDVKTRSGCQGQPC